MGQWDESELGPFPSRGDYEASFFVELPDTCEFVQLTPGIARAVVRRVLESERFSQWEREVALKEREALKEKEQDRVRHEVFSDSSSLFTGSYVNVL
jgi:hypothetical protein